MKKIIAITLVLAALAGCAASGVQVSQDAALQFKEGVTTEAQIIDKLGRPTGTMVTGDVKMISYSGMQYQVKGATFIPIVGAFIGGSDYTISTAVYQIGPDGILHKVTYSTHGGASRMGSTPADMTAAEPTAVK